MLWWTTWPCEFYVSCTWTLGPWLPAASCKAVLSFCKEVLLPIETFLFCWLLAADGGLCWFVVRENYWWLVLVWCERKIMLVGWISSQQNMVWSTSRSCVHGSQRLTLTIDLSGSIRGVVRERKMTQKCIIEGCDYKIFIKIKVCHLDPNF